MGFAFRRPLLPFFPFFRFFVFILIAKLKPPVYFFITDIIFAAPEKAL